MQGNGIQCPKCLQSVPVNADLVGTRIECPHCQASLAVPNSIGANDLFDDLFDEPAQRTKTKAAKPSNSQPAPVDAVQYKPKKLAADSERPPAHPSERTNEPSSAEIAADDTGADPFAYNDSKPIRIEGVSKNIPDADSFYFSCPTCDSKIQVREAQLGERIRCSDCFSTVTVEKPKRTAKQVDIWKLPATLRVSDDDDFKLEPPTERPDAALNMEAGFGLGSVQEDLLAPRVEPEHTASERKKSPVTAVVLKATNSNERVPLQKAADHLKAKVGQSVARPVSSPSSQAGKSLPSVGPKISTAAEPRGKNSVVPLAEAQWQQILKLEFAKDLDLLIRTIVTIVFLAVFYTLIESIWTTWAREDMNGGEKFGQLLPAMTAAPVCLGVAAWFLTITFSVVMRAVANGQTRIEEWIGFAPAEWLGLFAITAFGIWAALLPGVLLGYFAMAATGWFFLLPVLAAVSVFALSPLFLISSFFNESVLNIFSPEIVKTFSDNKANWPAAYRSFGIALSVFVIGIAIVFLPSLLFSLIGAAVQVFAITALAVLTGLHARSVIQCVRAS